MKATTVALRGMIWIMIALLVMPAGLLAQVAVDSQQADKFSKEELTQMLAPIALYPDSLTAQILMASTYPLEVVEAERWIWLHKDLKGEELDNALKEKAWDPSIKSLCHFPDILKSMSDKLDQTRKLGDAFLGQEEEVMATVQELRRKAKDQGTLKSTKEQKVIIEEEIVRIEPADPEIVYVPVYDPYYVYGPWWYPAYPPYYWYYPPGYVSGAYIGFGPSIFIGFGLFSWVWFDWPFHRISINIHHTKRFHHHRDRRGYDDRVWRHNPQHRKGVAYRDRRTGEHFGGRPPRVSPQRPEHRGYPDRRSERLNGRPPGGPGERRDRAVEPRERMEREGGRSPVQGREPAESQRVRTERERMQDRRPDTPFRGVGEGSFERRAGERGRLSTRGAEMRPSGGGRRGGEMRPSGSGGRGGEMRLPGGDSRGGGRDGGSRR